MPPIRPDDSVSKPDPAQALTDTATPGVLSPEPIYISQSDPAYSPIPIIHKYMDNIPKVGRFSSVVHLINILSALHISKEIRKRWTDDYHTPDLISDVLDFLSRETDRRRQAKRGKD